MDVLEAIHTRRTIFKFKPGGVPKDVIEKIFEAGLWAPNHQMALNLLFYIAYLLCNSAAGDMGGT